MDYQTMLLTGREQLNNTSDTAYQDSLTLLSFVLNIPLTRLFTQQDTLIQVEDQHQFISLIKRRQQGEPIAYLLSQCEFWSLPFKVTPACLIPRPDTELLVEKILAYYPKESTQHVLDLGTGSGIIAIALSKERPYWQITGTDQSLSALEIAQYNAEKLGASVEFKTGNWFTALSKQAKFNIIISNPPYLGSNDPHLSRGLRYEPQQALVGGERGDEMLQYIIQKATSYLHPNGRLWVEQGFDQAAIVKAYLEQYKYSNIVQHADLNGIIRISSGTYAIAD